MGLVVLAVALAIVPFRCSAAEAAADAMARAMARMMEAMGLFGDGGGNLAPALPADGSAGALGRMMGDAPAALRQMLPGGATALEGIWEGRDGGLLIVQGHRFRVQSAQGGYVEGLFQQRGDRIAMYDPGSDSVRPYEFAEQDGRLVLRDPAGSVYLYRRLWLGLPDPFADAATGGR